MSREELVSAYAAGSISRRVFIRRLVAAGVSVGAAASYAHLLSPARAAASPGSSSKSKAAARGATNATTRADFYTPPGISAKIKSKDLDRVAKKKELKVVVGVDEAATVDLFAEGKLRRKFKLIGEEQIVFNGPGEQVVEIPLNKKGRKAAKRREKLKTKLVAVARDLQGDVTEAELKKKIKEKKPNRD
jgi:hypothetical protein